MRRILAVVQLGRRRLGFLESSVNLGFISLGSPGLFMRLPHLKADSETDDAVGLQDPNQWDSQ